MSLSLPETACRLLPRLAWLNTPRPLGWEDFRGRPVLMEIWTSG